LLGKRSLLVLRFASCEATLDEVGLPEHRSEHQAPRRGRRTMIPNAIAEPPSERSVFGEPDRRQATFHGSLSLRSSHRKFGPMATLHLFDPAADNVDQLRAIGREFHGRSWSLGTSSNYSVVVSRDPLELLITASGKDKSALGPHDFVRVDAGGLVIDGSTRKSSAETLLHCLLAELVPSPRRRHPVGGGAPHAFRVEHHSLARRPSTTGSIRIEGYEMLKGLEGIGTHDTFEEVPIFANGQDMTGTVRTGSARGFTAADWSNPRRPPCHGFLLSGHGLYTWGRDLAEARRHIEIHEFLFEVVARQRMLAAAHTHS
jgi:methylthioribulose-1-phosphate dehydratase